MCNALSCCNATCAAALAQLPLPALLLLPLLLPGMVCRLLP
jgi:hypothetical protein